MLVFKLGFSYFQNGKKRPPQGFPPFLKTMQPKSVKSRRYMKRNLMNSTPRPAGLLLRMSGSKKIWPLSCVLPSAASWLILEAQSFRFLNRRSFWGLTGQACTTDPYRPAGRSWILRRALTRSILPIRNSAAAGSVRG